MSRNFKLEMVNFLVAMVDYLFVKYFLYSIGV